MDGRFATLCGRPRTSPMVIGSTVHAVGEPLRLSVGPYNQQSEGLIIARSIIHSGVIGRIEKTAAFWQIQFRRSFELGLDHDIWVWQAHADAPKVLDSNCVAAGWGCLPCSNRSRYGTHCPRCIIPRQLAGCQNVRPRVGRTERSASIVRGLEGSGPLAKVVAGTPVAPCAEAIGFSVGAFRTDSDSSGLGVLPRPFRCCSFFRGI